jgi:exosortase
MSDDKKSDSAHHAASAANTALVALAALTAALVWSYWTSLTAMAGKWANDPQYSHGWLVPVFSGAYLWYRRDRLALSSIGPNAWGLALLAAALGMRLAATQYYVEWFDGLSLVAAVGGVVLLAAGFRTLKWALPGVLFLAFMVPLPYTIESAMKQPLRELGTVVSTYAIQTLGITAFAEGNVIVVDEARIGVAEACSGLRMLVIFFALSTGVAIVSERSWWERLLIVASAVPIALIANVTRITTTAILHVLAGAEIADKVFHGLAGWLMMPLGLALLGAELWLITRLFIVEQEIPLTPVAGLGPFVPARNNAADARSLPGAATGAAAEKVSSSQRK